MSDLIKALKISFVCWVLSGAGAFLSIVVDDKFLYEIFYTLAFFDMVMTLFLLCVVNVKVKID